MSLNKKEVFQLVKLKLTIQHDNFFLKVCNKMFLRIYIFGKDMKKKEEKNKEINQVK